MVGVGWEIHDSSVRHNRLKRTEKVTNPLFGRPLNDPSAQGIVGEEPWKRPVLSVFMFGVA